MKILQKLFFVFVNNSQATFMLTVCSIILKSAVTNSNRSTAIDCDVLKVITDSWSYLDKCTPGNSNVAGMVTLTITRNNHARSITNAVTKGTIYMHGYCSSM